MQNKTSQTPVAIRCKLLIDGTGAAPVRDGVIIVDRGRVQAVGRAGDVPIPEGASTIDCGDATVLPGLIDPHAHACEDAATPEPITEQFVKPEALRGIRGYLSLRKDLHAGVTTVRLLGDGAGYVDRTLRDAIRSGELEGPHVLAAVQAIRPTHGTAPSIGVTADGVDQVVCRVRETIFLGADVIKLFVTNTTRGGTYLDYLAGDLTGVATYTKAEIAAAVEEAHRVGIKVAVHCIGGPALAWSLEAGVDCIEHANLLEEGHIPLFLRSGAILSDPNLQLFFDRDSGFESAGNKTHKWVDLPEWWHRKVRQCREQTKRNMSLALKAGVKFALATDLNHGSLWKEAKYFISEIGATPMQAIQAVTINGAEACGLEKETGTIEAGKQADLIAVRGNPLERIEALRDVTVVIKEGTVIRNDLF